MQLNLTAPPVTTAENVGIGGTTMTSWSSNSSLSTTSQLSSTEGCLAHHSQMRPQFPDFPYIGEIPVYSTWSVVLKALVYAILILVALVGNLAIISLIILHKTLRTSTNILIGNLAVADLCTALLPMWVTAVDDLQYGWTLGPILCKLSTFTTVMLMCTSTFTLTLISGDRFLAIVFPVKYKMKRTYISRALIATWLSAAIMASPLLATVIYEERTWSNYVERFCEDVDAAWPGCTVKDKRRLKHAYWTILLVLMNWLPLLLNSLAYIAIGVSLRRSGPSTGAASRSSIQRQAKKKVVIMIFSVFLLFITCWLPFQVSKLYEMYRSEDVNSESLADWYQNFFHFFALMLTNANSSINPLVYGGLNPNFRSAFMLTFMPKKLLLRQQRKRRTEMTQLETLDSPLSDYGNSLTQNGSPVSGFSARRADTCPSPRRPDRMSDIKL